MLKVATLTYETWGAANGRSRQMGPQLRLVQNIATAEEFLREQAVEVFVSTREQAETSVRKIPSSMLGETVPEGFSEPKSAANAADCAVEAFRDGTVLFFWNDQQVTDLSSRLDILGKNEALFVQLFPMVGG